MIARPEAVRAAQSALRSAFPRLAVDGVWGVRTEEAFGNAPSDLKDRVEYLARESGYTIDELRAPSVRAALSVNVRASGSNWIPEPEAIRISTMAADEFGIDRNVMVQFLKLEAAQRVISGVRHYDANSVAPNKLFRGLFQMGAPAWSDVRDQVGVGYEAVFDPLQNARAAAAYARANMRFATQRKEPYKGPFTAEVLYAMHNQGAGGFMKLLRERTSNKNLAVQSNAAKLVIAKALAQNGVSLA